MRKLFINLITFAPFVIAIILFKISSITLDIVQSDGTIIEQGFGYSAAGAILCIVGIIMLSIRLGLYLYRKIKS